MNLRRKQQPTAEVQAEPQRAEIVTLDADLNLMSAAELQAYEEGLNGRLLIALEQVDVPQIRDLLLTRDVIGLVRIAKKAAALRDDSLWERRFAFITGVWGQVGEALRQYDAAHAEQQKKSRIAVGVDTFGNLPMVSYDATLNTRSSAYRNLRQTLRQVLDERPVNADLAHQALLCAITGDKGNALRLLDQTAPWQIRAASAWQQIVDTAVADNFALPPDL
jgi:hypothetical protein